MRKALARAARSTPHRDAKSYGQLLLLCLAGWMLIALGVIAIAGLGLGYALLTIAAAFGLGNVTARYSDHRYPPPRSAEDLGNDG